MGAGLTTDPAGRFALAGLAPRPYRLRVWQPATALFFVSAPVRPGPDEVMVALPASAFHAHVRGKVERAGTPLPERLAVVVAYAIHVTHGGGGSMAESSAPVEVAADGTFTLQDVPRRSAELVFGTADGVRIAVPVEAIDADGRIAVRLALRRTLRILGNATGATAHVVDAGDTPLEVELSAGAARATLLVPDPVELALPPCTVPAAAAAVLLQRPDGTWCRVAIEDDAHGLARAMLPP